MEKRISAGGTASVSQTVISSPAENANTPKALPNVATDNFPLRGASDHQPFWQEPSEWIRGGPALAEIRSTFRTECLGTFRKRKRRPVSMRINTQQESNISGSDEGYNGSVSEDDRSSESSSTDEEDILPHQRKTNQSGQRMLLRKRSLVPPQSEIDDFSSEYCSDDFSRSSGEDAKPAASFDPTTSTVADAPILGVGGDVMAHILTFMEPPSVLDVLTAPLSKTWVRNFARNTELWRVLCLTDPFRATKIEPDVDFRWLYTSFVRCLRYLVRMTEDSRNGRPLTVPGQNQSHETYLIASNRNLHRFFSRARAATCNQPTSDLLSKPRPMAKKIKKQKSECTQSGSPKVTYGHSSLTQKLLGPSAQGIVGQVELPWSCAMYSIVNWMVGFRSVEGIQILCLKALPILLEDEQQRATARQAGLTELVLRNMVSFPDSVQLHASAFHTIVLLARPMGGREGMLFHSTHVGSNGIFSNSEDGTADGKSGMAVLLDSMRRFLSNDTLQAMGCWSMVNIALVPAQKNVLIKLGAIEVALKAMVRHPTDEEVQFRALFALINLIIPSETEGEEGDSTSDTTESTLYEEIDAERIVELVVTSMKEFYSNNSIMNRACLVLHNLSLNTSFHTSMLWSPRCYQMLEWCLTNYRSDPVLCQGAMRTLHRLQLTLSSNESVRRRFLSELRNEQQKSLQLVSQQALMVNDTDQNGPEFPA